MSLVLRAIIAAPAVAATFAHVANRMLSIAAADGKPAQYRDFIRNRFAVREVMVSPIPFADGLTSDDGDGEDAEAAYGYAEAEYGVQNRATCCGTMKLPVYNGGEEALEAELEELRMYLAAQPEEAAALV
jgi:hypothetical protein